MERMKQNWKQQLEEQKKIAKKKEEEETLKKVNFCYRKKN